jgi:hypothetical protein
MSDSVERLCLECASQIGKMRGARAKFCSGMCRDKHKKAIRQGGKETSISKLSVKAKQKGSVVFHSCVFYGTVDPFEPERCKCKKLVSEERAKSLINSGDAVDLETRKQLFTGGPIIQIGRRKRTPRSATLEKSHCERITQKPRRAAKTKEPTVEQLKALVDAQCAERYQEEKVRMEIYGELSQAFVCSLIREVPADKYDEQKREQTGISILSHFQDERGSVGRDVPSISFDYEKDNEDQNEEKQFDEEIETEQDKEDERTAEEVLAGYEER